MTYEKRPWTVNKERGMHFQQRAKLVKEWREHFRDEAIRLGLPAIGRCAIEVRVTSRILIMADTGACFSAQKAAVDGLRDAGVLADDTGDYVKWITFFPVEYVKGVDCFYLKVMEL